MKRTFVRVRAVFMWTPVWASILLVAAFVALGLVWPASNSSDFRLRCLAMAYQLIGAYTVWRDLTGSAVTFGREPILSSLRRRMTQDGRTVGQAVSIQSGAFGKARGTVRRPVDPNAATEARLQAIEANLQHIDADLKDAFNELSATESQLSREISDAVRLGHQEAQTIAKRLEEVAVGSYETLIFGAFWVGVGTVLSALAPELAKIIACGCFAALQTI